MVGSLHPVNTVDRAGSSRGKFCFLLLALAALSGCPKGGETKTAASSSTCPEPGAKLPLTKVMNPSFIKDYEKCDVSVDAEFLKTGNEGYMLATYDTSANTTFQVVAPGGSPQPSLGGTSFGTFAGMPKAASDILFTLKPGDKLILRGYPIGFYSGDTMLVSVFQAKTVEKAP